MSFETLIETHGYWVVFLGTLLEGETILVLAGIAAHSGYLRLPEVILAAFAGSLACDQIFFFLGRRHGAAVLERRPNWRAAATRVDALLERFDAVLIVGFRFLYGLRSVTPFAIGMSSAVSTRRFALLNAVGAAVWAVVIGVAGFVIGNAMEAFLGEARRYEAALFAIVAAIGMSIWAVHFVRMRRSGASGAEKSSAA